VKHVRDILGTSARFGSSQICGAGRAGGPLVAPPDAPCRIRAPRGGAVESCLAQ